jgi:hypothetical protein
MVAPKPLPLEIAQYISYDPDTGKFSWLVQHGGRPAGAPAGHWLGAYRYIRFRGRSYPAHRIAWLIMTGQDPLGLQIDHRDLDKANNVWSNLRLATSLQNNVNKPSQRSGLKGAYPQPSGRFVSYIRYNGKLISLGTFDTEAEANAAYAAAAAKLYGEFGRAA